MRTRPVWPVFPVSCVVVLCLLVSFLASCGERVIPTGPEAERVSVAPLASHTGPPPPLLDGPFDIPVPSTNLESFGSVGPLPVVSVDTTTFVEIVVEGTLSFQESTTFCGNDPPPDPLYGATVGPGGGPDGEFVVSMKMGSGGQGIPLRVDGENETRMTFAGDVFPGTITVSRGGGGATCAIAGGPRDGETGYSLNISGSQDLTITPREPFEVHADRAVILAGEAVTFQVTSDFEVSPFRAWWAAGDTLAEPAGPGTDGVGCGLTCTFAPEESGRLYVGAFVNSRAFHVRHSQRVWVRKSFEECEQGGDGGSSPASAASTASAEGSSGDGFDERTSDEGPACPLDPDGEGDDDDEEEPEETLVVSLSPGSAEVEPLLDRDFDAVAQDWSDPGTGFRLNDLVDLTVDAHWEPTGRPAAGAELRFTVEPVSGSGGHPHGGRPPGTFFTLGDRPTGQDQKKGVLRPALTLAADATGSAGLVYRTSGVSGVEVVRLEAAAEGQTATAEAEVTVRWRGLVPMARNGQRHRFKPQNPQIPGQRHGNINHWIDPAFRMRILDTFSDYFAAQSAPRFINGETRFVVTDVSLMWGGLFDVGSSAWRNPHKRHRTGRDLDLRLRTFSSLQRRIFIGICAQNRLVCEPHPTDGSPNHIHVFFIQ